jgi:hypothetical protein
LLFYLLRRPSFARRKKKCATENETWFWRPSKEIKRTNGAVKIIMSKRRLASTGSLVLFAFPYVVRHMAEQSRHPHTPRGLFVLFAVVHHKSR